MYHISQFILSFSYSFGVAGIHHKNETLSVLVVVAPQWPDLILATYVPYRKANVFVFYSLDVESNSRYSRHNFTEL